MENPKEIVVISDGTGRTAKRLMDAVLAQYAQKAVEFSLVDIFQEVRDKKRLNKILCGLDDECLVVFSIISKDLSQYCHDRLSDRKVLHLNVLEPMLSTMSKFLGVHPDYQPGILHKIDDKYYKKVDAIGYTVKHDDGRGESIEEADVVLLGPSRTCKTPISMYMACNFGMKVANIPIIPDDSLGKYLLSRLAAVEKQVVVGLTMHPDVLAHLRRERSQSLTTDSQTGARIQDYWDLDEIRKELRFSRDLYAKGGFLIVDVTRRAIEEISRELLDRLGHHE